MPTVNPRVNVTLSPSLDALVQTLAKHQRTSKAQVLRELLEAAEPALQRAAALMDAASRAGPDVLAGLSGALLRSQEKLEDALSAGLARLDSQTDLVSEAEAVRGRRPGRATGADASGARPRPAGGLAGASGAGNPPASNRGVRSEGQGAGKARKTARRA